MKNDRMTDAVNDFLRQGRCTATSIHYDMNSIKIRLFEKDGRQAFMLYLYPPWRIVRDDALVNSSAEYPADHLYESREEHRAAFMIYCQSTSSLETETIHRVEAVPTTNDLTVYWESGCRLEKPCMSREWDYHIYDRLNALLHDVGFDSYAVEPISGEEKNIN